MPNFSKNSKNKLNECHPDLRLLFNEVIQYYNFAVITGHRKKEAQNQAFFEERSMLKYPQSKHNKKPSLAIDAVPWFKDPPHIRWEDKDKFYHFIGFVQGIAIKMGIGIRSGGDWDDDGELHDQNFFDLAHFEIKD